MIGTLLTLLCLVPVALSDDDDIFKTCSTEPFCAALRYQNVDENSQFSANTLSVSVNNGIVTLPLKNLNGDELDLQITVSAGRKARVKILEKNHNRYELADVLAKEFLPVSSIHASGQGGLLTINSENDPNFSVLVKGSAPFSVEFIYDNRTEILLKADRLVIQNDDASQAFSFDVVFEGAKTLYGLHHHAYKLALGETADGSVDPFHLRNFDAYYYTVGSTRSMYGAVPAIYGHSADRTSGVFLHNAAQQWIDITYSGNDPSAYFMTESGTLDLFFMMGPKPKDIVRQFTDLTGRSHLPQLWTLGYHQCRYSYLSQEDVKEVVANMDNNDFPMDAIWLDIDYTDDKRYFTWNPDTFNDPEEMQRNLSSTNKKLVTIIDPHYKVDDNYPVYAGAKEDLFMKWPNGSNFEGHCWPGLSSWFDFLNPKARDFYASWFAYNKFNGSTETLAGIWNDMNEPALFEEEYEKTMPSEVLHIGNVPHSDIHNMYGFLHTKATHQGLMQRDNGTKRPFVLTRSHFAGSQRYAAMWTGDNRAGWDYLRITYPECVLSNILGMVFCGADVGGFNGNPNEELLQRWYQAAIWLPFFRQHSGSDTNRREPYLFSEEVKSVIRTAMKLRYEHIPVWYTLFYEHTRTGDPIVRPFFYEYPDVPEQDNHLLLGSDILARPVMEEGASSIAVVFPGSDTVWYRVDDDTWTIHRGNTTEKVDVNIKTSPYYYRAGSIITRKENYARSTTDLQDEPLTLYINLDENNNAQGTYYQDDFVSFKYSTDNIYLYVRIRYIPGINGVQITTIDGDSSGMVPIIQKIVVHNLTSASGTEYTKNSDGVPLQSLDIAKHLKQTINKDITILL